MNDSIDELKRKINKVLNAYAIITKTPLVILCNESVRKITKTNNRKQGWSLEELDSELRCKQVLAYLQHWLRLKNYKWDRALEGIAEQYTQQELAEIESKKREAINSQPSYDKWWQSDKSFTYGT